MVLHLRAPKGKVSVEVMLNRAKYFDRTGKVNDHTIYLSGNLGKNALEFAMCLSAKAKGGRVYTMGAWHAAKPLRKRNWECIHATKRMMAGFPHLYYMASPHLALEFLEQCVSYRKEQEKTR